MGYIGIGEYGSLEEEIELGIDDIIKTLKRVTNWTPEKVESSVREDFFTLATVTLSAYYEYPTYEDLERVRRIVRFRNEEIDKTFPPEYYQHVLRENMFKRVDKMIVFWTTKKIVKYENQLYKEKPFALEKYVIQMVYSFKYLNLLKRITEYFIGSSPRKATSNQLFRVSFIIQAQTNYIMNNLEILNLCRGRNAEYAISPHGYIMKKTEYEEMMKKSLESLIEASKVSYKEAKERRKQEEWEELQRLNEEEEEEKRREEEEELEMWEEEEKRKAKEQEEHFRRIREMNEWMMWEDDFKQNNPQLFN